MLGGLLAGLVLGAAAHSLLGESSALEFWIAHTTEPVGQIFLRLLFVLVIPLILSALALAGSLPVVAMIPGMIGVPPEGIDIVLGVDRFLDMCRTTINVTGDLAAAVLVARAS
jgi:Na+/H+-dicarboxylate symporter